MSVDDTRTFNGMPGPCRNTRQTEGHGSAGCFCLSAMARTNLFCKLSPLLDLAALSGGPCEALRRGASHSKWLALTYALSLLVIASPALLQN